MNRILHQKLYGQNALKHSIEVAILSGLLGDRLYHSYVQHTLDRLKEEESRDAFLVNFLRKSAVSPLLAALSYAAVSLIPNFVMSFIVQ